MVFKKGDIGNPKGRPPDMLNNSMKKLTKDELEDIATIIVKGNVDELKAVIKDPTSTVIKVMIMSVCMQIIKKGQMEALDKLLNRMIGKVKDTVDVTGNGFIPTTVMLNIPDNGRAAKHTDE